MVIVDRSQGVAIFRMRGTKRKDQLVADHCPVASGDRQLRITIVLSGLGLSGGVRCVGQLSRALTERGHKVVLVAGKQKRSKWWPKRPAHIKTKYRELIARLNKRDGHLKSLGVSCFISQEDSVDFRDVPDADLVLGTWWQSVEEINGWPASKGLKAHYVQGHDAYAADAYKNSRGEILNRISEIYRLPIKKFVVSKWLVSLLEELYQAKDVTYVPNAIDPKQFFTGVREKPACPLVGFLYSAMDIKAPEVAFDALRIVQQRYPDTRVISYGMRGLNKKYAKKLRNHRHFILPSISQLRSLYQQSSCWVASSRSEGFGLPGFEANACGCPIVSTACGGPEDYIDDGVNGYLVPVDDPVAMASAIGCVIEFSSDQWSTMSAAGAARASEFSWDETAKRFEEGVYSYLRGKSVTESSSWPVL